MRIAGLIPFTLTDYPGKVAAVLFTQGCNFRCPFCHNGELLPMETGKLMPEADFFEFLHKRQGQLDGIVVTGGEPTLQTDLGDFLRRVRTFDVDIKLDSNGSRPEVLKELIDAGLVDFIAMDIKAPKEKYDRLTGVRAPFAKIQESISLIAQSGLSHQFRTTVVPALLNEGDVDAIKAMVPEGSPFVTQEFRPENALDPALREKCGGKPAKRRAKKMPLKVGHKRSGM